MYRILASILIVILLAGAALAQAPPLYFGIEARPVMGRWTLDLRDDQVRLNASRTVAEITAGAVSPGLFRARYTLVTGFGNSDQVTPNGPLQVAGTDFGKKQGNGGAGSGTSGTSATKPVTVDWRADPGHRLELVGLTRFPIRPAAIAEFHSATLTAIGEKDGKPTQESETFRRWLLGLGGEATWSNRYERARAIIVGSDRYLFAEASYFQRIAPWAAARVGLQHSTKSLDGVRIRASAWWLGIEAAW